MKIVPVSVQLVHATPYPARVVESMGRICYQSEHMMEPCSQCVDWGPLTRADCVACGGYGSSSLSADKFVRMVLERGHESVIEHVSAGFKIVTDRGVTHELVRHRLAAFSQESTRFCNYSKDQFGGELSFIKPPELRGLAAEATWRDACEGAELRYLNLLASEDIKGVKTAPQIARSVLPNSLKSEIGMTCNAREWRHVLRLRLSPKAHPQMRQVMALILPLLQNWFPAAFAEFSV